MTLTLDDDLAARLRAMATEADSPPEALAISLLEDLVTHIGWEGNLPVLRVPPGTPPLTTEEVNRLLNGDYPPAHREYRRVPRCLCRRRDSKRGRW